VRDAFVAWLIVSSALNAAAPPARLKDSQLEAVHAQRVDWMKKRVAMTPLGIYRDYRAVLTRAAAPRADLLKSAQDAGDQIVFAEGASGVGGGVLFLPLPGRDFQGMEIYRRPEESAEAWRKLRGLFQQYPDEVLGADTDFDADSVSQWDRATVAHAVTGLAYSESPSPGVISRVAAFRNTSTHILAREFTSNEVRASLTQGHAYVAHDWLCDPTGFTFFAANNLGVFDMGDTVPTGLLSGRTELQAYFPVAAKIKLIRNGARVVETEDSKFSYPVKEPGVFRLEAWLSAGGEDRPWILSNPIYVQGSAEIRLPAADAPPNVESRLGIAYAEGAPADGAKHKLDLYLPKDKTNFPVLFFVHGGSWRTGDRSLYAALGNYFAARGYGVAIPSYRLGPQNPHPAQMEDVAAAFAWVYRNSTDFGGDKARIYAAGHSAGGHLVSLLALDRRYLQKHNLPLNAIHAVVTMSGVYDVREAPAFVFDGNRAEASPIEYAGTQTPPFLITYCQWDYLGLPKQARDFAAALKKSFNHVQTLYVGGETHISEIISAVRDGSPLSNAILTFLNE
jgi:acetyl esterase/lipase